MIFFLDPLMNLHTVGRLVPHFHKTSLHFFRPAIEVHEFMTTNAGVCRKSCRSGVLLGIGWIQGMEGRGENRMTGHMIPPVIKSHSPRIGIGVTAKRRKSMAIRSKLKPGTIVRAHGTIRGLDLAVMKNGFPEKQISFRGPNKIVQGMMRIFTAEAGQQSNTLIGFPVSIRISNPAHERLFRYVNTSITQFKRKRNVQIIGKHRGFIRSTVFVNVFKDDDFIARLIPRIDMGIGC